MVRNIFLKRIRKNFSTILHTQFNYFTQPVTPFKNSTIYSKKLIFTMIINTTSQFKITKYRKTDVLFSCFYFGMFNVELITTVSQMDGREFLTEFQIDKFRYFFYHVLDLNNDHVISEEDFLKLNDRIRHYMDWSVNTIQFLALKEVHNIFQVIFPRKRPK